MRGPIRDITVSPDGKTLVLVGGRAGTQSGEAYLWHAGESQVAATLGGHRGPVRAAAFTSQGRRVVTACDDGYSAVLESARRGVRRNEQGHAYPRFPFGTASSSTSTSSGSGSSPG